MRGATTTVSDERPPREVTSDSLPAQSWLPRALLVIGRLGLAYLFFTQLFWRYCQDKYPALRGACAILGA